MRIKINFIADKNGRIDFSYQHQIQAVIYRFLASSDPDFANWLHQQGYIYRREQNFKLFVFSGITFHNPIKPDGGFSFKATPSSPFLFSFEIASPVDMFIQHLVSGIFNTGNVIYLGHQRVCVHSVESLAEILPDGHRMPDNRDDMITLDLRPLESPIFVKKPGENGERDIYLFPENNEYETYLNQNLIRKYETLYGKEYRGKNLKFEFSTAKGKSEKQFTVYKTTPDGQMKPTGHIKGTLRPFKVSGSPDLIRIGLECGFGQNNSMGCGYVGLTFNQE